MASAVVAASIQYDWPEVSPRDVPRCPHLLRGINDFVESTNAKDTSERQAVTPLTQSSLLRRKRLPWLQAHVTEVNRDQTTGLSTEPQKPSPKTWAIYSPAKDAGVSSDKPSPSNDATARSSSVHVTPWDNAHKNGPVTPSFNCNAAASDGSCPEGDVQPPELDSNAKFETSCASTEYSATLSSNQGEISSSMFMAQPVSQKNHASKRKKRRVLGKDDGSILQCELNLPPCKPTPVRPLQRRNIHSPGKFTNEGCQKCSGDSHPRCRSCDVAKELFVQPGDRTVTLSPPMQTQCEVLPLEALDKAIAKSETRGAWSGHSSREVGNGIEGRVDETINTPKGLIGPASQNGSTNDLHNATSKLCLVTSKCGVLNSIPKPAGNQTDLGLADPEVTSPNVKKMPRKSKQDVQRLKHCLLTRVAPIPLDPSEHSIGVPSSKASLLSTTPRLYPSGSAESIVRDFAYPRSKLDMHFAPAAARCDSDSGHRRSVIAQGTRSASANGNREELVKDAGLAPPRVDLIEEKLKRVNRTRQRRLAKHDRETLSNLRTLSAGPAISESQDAQISSTSEFAVRQSLRERQDTHNLSPGQASSGNSSKSIFQGQAYYRQSPDAGTSDSAQPELLVSKNFDLKHPRRPHVSLREGEGFSLGRYHKRQPIAREWNTKRKRISAVIACLNTIFIGLIAGIYAGEVPRIQFELADTSHWVIFGNMLFFAGMAISTAIFWPLPLLHGRRSYTLIAFGLMLPLHIPQALAVSRFHGPSMLLRIALLLPRAMTGFALGFANINILPTLLDLFGASLQSTHPHQEVVVYDDVRRQGGGIGVWLGIWTLCFSSSLAIGFCAGALIICKLDPDWGFWIIVVLLAFCLLLNVAAPETRTSPYRKSLHHFYDDPDYETVKRRVARGEVSLHLWNVGPKWWYHEVWAGIVLTTRMALQPGFFILMAYLAWINAQLTLAILLLGALLSREYRWPSYSVGLAALAVPAGALLAMPLTKASWFSRARSTPPRTDSMTMRNRELTYSSHLMRRIIFSSLLPLAGLGCCLTATGPPLHWSPAVIFAGLVGFLSDMGNAECIGLIMETFDLSDLQPGVNTKHRLQSLSASQRRSRTNYSSFPRVCAGFFAAQSLGFLLAAAATVVSGRVTDAYGTQTAMSIVAGILAAITVLFFIIVWRWKEVQVIPNYTCNPSRGSKLWDPHLSTGDPEWRPVVIGNPSGQMRRMNFLELGRWSRWSEIRRLNKLVQN